MTRHLRALGDRTMARGVTAIAVIAVALLTSCDEPSPRVNPTNPYDTDRIRGGMATDRANNRKEPGKS